MAGEKEQNRRKKVCEKVLTAERSSWEAVGHLTSPTGWLSDGATDRACRDNPAESATHPPHCMDQHNGKSV